MKIGFTGDFFINGRLLNSKKKSEWKVAFRDLHDTLTANDFNVIDLEAPITESSTPIEKTGPNLKNPPFAVEVLKSLNCSIVATANNHFFDYGLEGITDTYQHLSENGIRWVGSGINKKEASSTFLFDDGKVKVGIINVCENEWTTIADGGNDAGCFGLDIMELSKEIINSKGKVDHLVVIYHGGHEHYNLPSPRIKKLLRYCVDLGASAVVAHHTHIISGYEVYKDAPIFYSTGNICFDRDRHRDSPWNYGMVVNLIFSAGAPVQYEYTLFNQNSEVPGVVAVKKEELTLLENSITRLNEIIQSDEKLEEEFVKFTDSNKILYNFWIQPIPSKFFRLVEKGLFPSLLTRAKRKLLLNLIRCEAHRDVLLNTLKE